MRSAVSIFVACTFTTASALAAAQQEKITYQEHVRPIFIASCVSCHNPDKNKAGLDLTSYAATMKGSSSAKIIEPGDPDSSLVYMLVTHQAEPHMPLKASKLPDPQLEIIRKWIADGAPDSAGSAVAVASKPKIELKLAAASSAKPQFLPMPKDLPLEPMTRGEHAAAAGAVAANPWSPFFAISSPHQILLYHAQSLQLLGVLPFPEGLPKVLNFSRNGAILLAGGGVGGQSGSVALYDVVTGRRVTQVGEEYDEVLAADISPDQSTVALGGPAKVLKVFSVADGALLHKLTQHTDWITAVAYSPDGVLLASGDRNGGLRVWEAGTAAEFYTLNGHKAAVNRLCFRADSNVLASASEDGTVKLWDMNSGTEIKSWSAHGSGVMSVDFAPDGRLVTAGRDQVVRLWDGDGKKLLDLEPLRDIALHAVFAQQGAAIVAADFTGQVRVSAAADGKPIGQTDTNPPTIAERTAEARRKLAEAEAAAAKTTADLNAAREAAAKTSAELQAAQAAATTAGKAVESAQAKVTDLTAASQAATAAVESAKKVATATQAQPATQASTRPVATQPAATQAAAKISVDAAATAKAEVEAKQAAAQKASAELAGASTALTKAQADLSAANAAVTPRVEAVKAAEAVRVKAEQAAGTASGQVAGARGELNKWKLAEISVQLSAAQEELASLSGVSDQLAKALAQIESANRTLMEGPQRVAAAEQRFAKAKESHAAAVQAQQAAASAAAEREMIVQKIAEIAKGMQSPTTKPLADASVISAAAKLKESLDVLSPGLESLRKSAAQATDAAKKAADEVTAAEAALAAAKSELAAAPDRLEQARKQISQSVVQQLQAAKNRIDRLQAEKKRLEASP
jgi:hypothetical protein